MTREHQEAAVLTTPSSKARSMERGQTNERGQKDVEAPAPAGHAPDLQADEKELASLFQPEVAAEFRAKWDAIQVSFVDDPRNAVRRGDELVARVLKELAETFSHERDALQKQLGRPDETTESLRLTLRRHRSFFERLLSL